MLIFRSISFFLLLALCTQSTFGQVSNDFVRPDPPSPKKAFVLSLALPGLGHKHANGGSWNALGTVFAATDVGLWVTLFTGERRHNHFVQSYETLARTSAGADLSGKDRTFYLTLASFESSEEFRDAMLRTRQWDRIDYANRPGYEWSWDSTENFSRYRSLREDAESLRRRRSIVIASLVANRLISGIMSARKASVARRTQVSLRMGAPIQGNPVLNVRIGF